MPNLKYHINAFYQSLFSRAFYADLIANKKILGFRYLMILALILAIPVSIEVRAIMQNIFGAGNSVENIEYVAKQVPDIFIENGHFKINAQANQNILSSNGQIVAVLDVENKVNDLDSYDKVVVISSDSMRIKLPNNAGFGVAILNPEEVAKSFQQYFEPQTQGVLKLDKEQFFGDLAQISKTPMILIILMSFLWYLVNYSLSAIFFSFVAGIFMAIMCKTSNFDFRRTFRIAAFTSTAVMLLELTSTITGGLFMNASLVYFITHLLYIHFAVESYRRYSSGSLKLV